MYINELALDKPSELWLKKYYSVVLVVKSVGGEMETSLCGPAKPCAEGSSFRSTHLQWNGWINRMESSS